VIGNPYPKQKLGNFLSHGKVHAILISIPYPDPWDYPLSTVKFAAREAIFLPRFDGKKVHAPS
jgi:hypothetical protein